MKWVVFVLLMIVLILLIICYSLLVVASDADDRAEEMYRRWKEERDE